MKNTLILTLLFLILTMSLPYLSLADPTAIPKGWGKEPTFKALPASRDTILTGYTRSRWQLDIVSEETGRCVKVWADVGDVIGKDGNFAELDRTFIKLDIRKNSTEIKRLEDKIHYDSKEVERYRKLVKSETADQSTLDKLEMDLAQTRFQLEGLQTHGRYLAEQAERYLIKVPAGWTIVERTVEPGEWVAKGAHLGRAGDYRTLMVPFSLAPEEYQTLKQKKNLTLYFPHLGQNGLNLPATIERISPAFDPQTRKIKVELIVGKGLPEKRGGLRAELGLDVPDPSGAVLVPRSAVTERYEEHWLATPEGDNIKVMLLGKGREDSLRIRSPKVKPGDVFSNQPKQ